MSTYKPSEHDGLKQDGTPDKRVNPEHGFGGDHERASELGKQGGKTGGKIGDDAEAATGSAADGADGDDSGDYKPTENDGLRKDGEPDGRVKGN